MVGVTMEPRAPELAAVAAVVAEAAEVWAAAAAEVVAAVECKLHHDIIHSIH